MAQMVKNLPAGDLGSTHVLEKECIPTPVLLPGEFYDRGAWLATVHGVTKSWTQLSD